MVLGNDVEGESVVYNGGGLVSINSGIGSEDTVVTYVASLVAFETPQATRNTRIMEAMINRREVAMGS